MIHNKKDTSVNLETSNVIPRTYIREYFNKLLLLLLTLFTKLTLVRWQINKKERMKERNR